MKKTRNTPPKALIIILHIIIHVIVTTGLCFILSYLLFNNPHSQITDHLIGFIMALAVICIDYFANKLILLKSKIIPEYPTAVHIPDLILFLPIVFFVTATLISLLYVKFMLNLPPTSGTSIAFYVTFYLAIISTVFERILLIKTSNKQKRKLKNADPILT